MTRVSDNSLPMFDLICASVARQRIQETKAKFTVALNQVLSTVLTPSYDDPFAAGTPALREACNALLLAVDPVIKEKVNNEVFCAARNALYKEVNDRQD